LAARLRGALESGRKIIRRGQSDRRVSDAAMPSNFSCATLSAGRWRTVSDSVSPRARLDPDNGAGGDLDARHVFLKPAAAARVFRFERACRLFLRS